MCMGEDSGELRLMSQKFNKKNKRFKDFRLEILPFIECFTLSLFLASLMVSPLERRRVIIWQMRQILMKFSSL